MMLTGFSPHSELGRRLTAVLAVAALLAGPLTAAMTPCQCSGPSASAKGDDAQPMPGHYGCCARHAPPPASAATTANPDDPDQNEHKPCPSPYGCPGVCCAGKTPATANPLPRSVPAPPPVAPLLEQRAPIPPSLPLDDLFRPPRG